MTTTRYLVAGDRGATDDFEFVGVQDLLGIDTITGHVWKTVGARDPHTVEIEVLDAETRMCRVHWGDAVDDWLPSLDAATAQSWRFEVQASWPEAPAQTSPRRTAVILKVRPQGDHVAEEA